MGKKKLTDIFFIKKILNKRGKNSNGVFFTCLSTTSILYAGYAAKKIEAPVYFFIHGEIEYIFKNKISFVSKIRGKIYKSFLKRLGDNSKILVLSEIIKARLIADGIVASNKIICVEHPIVLEFHEENPVSQERIVFGHIGIALKKKGSASFFKLATWFKSTIQAKKVEFRLIGKIEKDLIVDDISCVKVLTKNNESLTQLQFEQGINLIDYSIFTFDEDNYVYRASGTVMDAIAYAKPIIALKQDYFNHLFSQAGNIGFLCNDFEELKFLVQSLINRDENLLQQYPTQQQNLKKLRHKHLVHVIKEGLLSALK